MSERVIEKKERKKLISKKVVVILLLIVVATYILVNKYAGLISELNYGAQKSKPLSINVEELSHNSNYAGVGQEKVEGMDGYDTTFTAVDGKVYKEYKQVGNASYKKSVFAIPNLFVSSLLIWSPSKCSPSKLTYIFLKSSGV